MTKPFSFSDTYKQAEKDYGIGGRGSFKVKEGANRIRLMSECIPHPGSYKGTPNFKFLCYVIDRAVPQQDDKVKIQTYFMPVTVFKGIEALQQDSDWAFTEMPMPYDIVIDAKNAGTKEVDYSVFAKPKTELTEAETTALTGMKSIQEVQDKIREKELNNSESQSEDDVNAELAGK